MVIIRDAAAAAIAGKLIIITRKLLHFIKDAWNGKKKFCCDGGIFYCKGRVS